MKLNLYDRNGELSCILYFVFLCHTTVAPVPGTWEYLVKLVDKKWKIILLPLGVFLPFCPFDGDLGVNRKPHAIHLVCSPPGIIYLLHLTSLTARRGIAGVVWRQRISLTTAEEAELPSSCPSHPTQTARRFSRMKPEGSGSSMGSSSRGRMRVPWHPLLRAACW